MKTRAILIISWLAGVALFVAGIAFLYGPATPSNGDITIHIARLAENQLSNFAYVGAVYICYILFIPVVVLLTAHLYSFRPIGSVIASTLFCLGGAVEMAATLASLSRWVYAIPEGAKGNATAIGLFKTLTVQFLILDFAGVALVYAAAIIYAILLWKMHRPTSYLLLVSTFLLLVGIPATLISAHFGMFLSMLSILTYAVACVGVGYVVRKLVRMKTLRSATNTVRTG
jgi:uncharacterized membrane protein (DUF2068 family)